jgi:hypothetical protein
MKKKMISIGQNIVFGRITFSSSKVLEGRKKRILIFLESTNLVEREVLKRP